MTARNLPPRAVGYRETAAMAREAMAEDLFRPDDVFAALAAAAAKGETFHIIKPTSPINLMGTRAARDIEMTLNREGLTFAWSRIDNPLGVNESPFFHLKISWD